VTFEKVNTCINVHMYVYVFAICLYCDDKQQQCVAVCCGVLQCVAVCCSVLQCVAIFAICLYCDHKQELHRRVSRHFECVAVCCSVLQCVAVCCIDVFQEISSCEVIFAKVYIHMYVCMYIYIFTYVCILLATSCRGARRRRDSSTLVFTHYSM